MSNEESQPHAAVPEATSPLPEGYALHEFRIERVVGEGGFGVVYIALDLQLQRRVALKEYMPATLATRGSSMNVTVRSERHRETFELGLRSFVNEARLLASFDHPSLVKVHRFWEQHGTAYMAMPFYEGPTLRSWVRSQAIPPSQAWLQSLLLPLMDALELIHSDRCYHRDIAPDNILLTGPLQKPVLLDFGAARRVISDATQALTTILKPGYAPIEQYAEMPSMKQGAWTDVYALCAVLYSVIARKPPMPAVARIVRDELEPLSAKAQGRYSQEFMAAIMAGLSVRPEDRPQTIADLRPMLLGAPLPEAPTPTHIDEDDRTVLVAGARRPTAPAQPTSRRDAAPPSTAFAPTDVVGERTVFARTDLATARLGADVDRTVFARTEAATERLDAPPAPVAARPEADDDKTVLVRSSANLDATRSATRQAGSGATPRRMASRPGSSRRVAVAAATAVVVAGAGAMAWWLSHRSPPDAPVMVATTSPAPAPPPSVPPPAAQPGPPPMPQASAISAPERLRPGALLDEIVRQAQLQNIRQAIAEPTRVTIGQDRLRFRVTAKDSGYVYAFMTGSDDGHLWLLFPNTIDKANRIEAGKELVLPRPSWNITADGPAGTDRIVLLISPLQRDFADSPFLPGEPIREYALDKLQPIHSLADLHEIIGTPRCAAKATACADNFGAAKVEIQEAASGG